MLLSKNNFFWVGELPDQYCSESFLHVQSIDEIPLEFGGMVCISYQDGGQTDEALKRFYQQTGRWSWCVYVTDSTPYSECVTDGVFEEEVALHEWQEVRRRLEAMQDYQSIDPIIGWLGVNRRRRIMALKRLESSTIYSYPIIDLFFPDVYSTYRYVLSEQNRGVLEAEHLISRIRVCSNCNSGHLNYVEVCPECSSIDIDSQSSLHCFTCGHVGDQQSFQRRGKLECPKCLTQLRHIGVDYDRPLENHVCNSCTSLFVEAATISQCLSCDEKIKVEELVIRKLYQLKLGEVGEYVSTSITAKAVDTW